MLDLFEKCIAVFAMVAFMAQPVASVVPACAGAHGGAGQEVDHQQTMHHGSHATISTSSVATSAEPGLMNHGPAQHVDHGAHEMERATVPGDADDCCGSSCDCTDGGCGSHFSAAAGESGSGIFSTSEPAFVAIRAMTSLSLDLPFKPPIFS